MLIFFKGYVMRNNFLGIASITYDSFTYHDVHSVNVFNYISQKYFI